AAEDRVLAHADVDVQIARRPAVAAGLALAREADPVAVVDARRNLHRQRAALADSPAPGALPARLLDDRARAPAGRTGLLNREKALRNPDLARAPAGRAAAGLAARLRAVTA